MFLNLPFCLTMDGSFQRSVFIRTLLRYLTLTLRRAPTCFVNGREPDELNEHHRLRAMGTQHPRFFSPFYGGHPCMEDACSTTKPFGTVGFEPTSQVGDEPLVVTVKALPLSYVPIKSPASLLPIFFILGKCAIKGEAGDQITIYTMIYNFVSTIRLCEPNSRHN